MYKKLHLLLIFAILFVTACGGDAEKERTATTKELIKIVEENAQIKRLLIASIEKAKQTVPDTMYNPAQTLEQYYDFVDWSTRCMPWDVVNFGTNELYGRIDQSINYWYFIPDQPLAELEGNGKYRNSLQYIEPYRTWLIKYAKAWGEYLSTAESWNDEYYELVRRDERFGLDKGWYESPSNWHSFNDFFARHLSSPDVRPIVAPSDDLVIASAADSKFHGIWPIDDSSMIVHADGVLIKSHYFNSIEALMGEGSAYGKAFAGGTLTHSFLSVSDYHRYHFPVGGTIKEMNIIAADAALGGIETWNDSLKRYVLICNTPGWQTIETRGAVVVDNPELGLVAMLPIGMSQVNSINFEKNIKVGDVVKKGDMLGYFLFGGSDFVILFQKDVKFTPSIEKLTHLLMGQELGKSTIIK